MFGYLLPDKQELKMKDFALYRAAYCGVCRAIKRAYGELPRFSVSYDAAVLALLLIGVSGEQPKSRRRRCILNPVTPKPVLEGHEALDYVAAVSVSLAWGRLRDAWTDDRNAAALPAMARMRLAARRSAKRYPAQAEMLETCLKDLAALEKDGCKEIDRPADVMGNLMSGIVTSGPAFNPASTVLLRSMGYHLGRWIYLVDALDDREKDAKRGSYNPILAMGGGPDAVKLTEQACVYSASQAAAVFDLLEFQWGRDVLHNVLYNGMPATLRNVTDKENPIHDRSVENTWNPAGLQ